MFPSLVLWLRASTLKLSCFIFSLCLLLVGSVSENTLRLQTMRLNSDTTWNTNPFDNRFNNLWSEHETLEVFNSQEDLLIEFEFFFEVVTSIVALTNVNETSVVLEEVFIFGYYLVGKNSLLLNHLIGVYNTVALDGYQLVTS